MVHVADVVHATEVEKSVGMIEDVNEGSAQVDAVALVDWEGLGEFDILTPGSRSNVGIARIHVLYEPAIARTRCARHWSIASAVGTEILNAICFDDRVDPLVVTR